MVPQLDAVQYLLIKALLKKGFETKLIASEASCSVCAIYRNATLGTHSVGRRSRITLPMRKALCDILVERPYLYRCEIVDLLSCRFHKRISERSLGRTLRSVGWTRTKIYRTAIVQQRDTDLRHHYLHRIQVIPTCLC